VPDRLTRHAASRWEWGASPSRQELTRRAANDDPAAKSPGKKDPAKCKGNGSGEHVPVLRLHHESPEDEFRARCRWRVVWRNGDGLIPGWFCAHEVACEKCGKIFHAIPGFSETCPVYPGTPEQRVVIEQQIIERNEVNRLRNATTPRRPVITARQSYRKRSSDGNNA
jgi:hypothetical protein